MNYLLKLLDDYEKFLDNHPTGRGGYSREYFEVKRTSWLTNRFVRIDTPNERKLKFEGVCKKCQKLTSHRFDSGDTNKDYFRCMKCKAINEGNYPKS